MFVVSSFKLLPYRSGQLACYLLWAAASLLLCLRKQMLSSVSLVLPETPFHFTINAKKMARDRRNIQRTEHLAALPAALYPLLVLGLLKPAFPARSRKARYCSEAESSQPEIAAGTVFGIWVDLQKRGLAACLFSRYSYYSSKLTVNASP